MKPRESAKAKAAASTKSCPKRMRQCLPEPALNEPLWTERFGPSYRGKRALSFGGNTGGRGESFRKLVGTAPNAFGAVLDAAARRPYHYRYENCRTGRDAAQLS